MYAVASGFAGRDDIQIFQRPAVLNTTESRGVMSPARRLR